MDLKILSLATDKTTDKLQEFLQTLKTDDVSTAQSQGQAWQIRGMCEQGRAAAAEPQGYTGAYPPTSARRR